MQGREKEYIRIDWNTVKQARTIWNSLELIGTERNSLELTGACWRVLE
jgi:hypothetical protein